jgi:hypothetical protein
MNQTHEQHTCAFQRMDNLFLYAAAPILQGIKPGVLIPVQAQCEAVWAARGDVLCFVTGLEVLELRNAAGKLLLLIYDADWLHETLQTPQAQQLLDQCGYPVGPAAEPMLIHLAWRFSQTACPHEVGVFLGYPPEDVLSFIVHEGKHCLCCRYWKVYHDVAQAQELFHRMDEAFRFALEVLERSLPLRTAVHLLRS